MVGLGFSLSNQVSNRLVGKPNFAGVIDNLSVAPDLALSTRLLSSSYNGPAMRLRRSSDQAEQDIGFTAAGGLDTFALAAFVGAGESFVTTWYDQSGNGNHATRLTAADQPRLTLVGTPSRMNGKIAIRFLGTQTGGLITAQNYLVGGGTVFVSHNAIQAGHLFSHVSAGNWRVLLVTSNSTMNWTGASATIVNNGTHVPGSSAGNLMFSLAANGAYSVREDGVDLITGTSAANVAGTSYNSVGARWAGATAVNAFNGLIGEFIAFNGIILPVADRDALEVNRLAYWGAQ